MNQLLISPFSTAYLRTYLEQLNYTVKVEVDNRPTKYYNQAYSVKFLEGCLISEEFCMQIQEKFPGFARHISPERIFLPTPCWQEILADFPPPTFENGEEKLVNEEQKEGVENIIVNAQVNTLKQQESKQVQENLWLLPSQHKVYREQVRALTKEKDFPSKVLSQQELSLLEKYICDDNLHHSKSSFEDYPLERYVTAKSLDGIACKMYEIAFSLGFPQEGKVLNPCCGIGRFIKAAPYQEHLTGIEWDSTAASIARKLYPKATIHVQRLEKAFLAPPDYIKPVKEAITWLKDYPFDLVIGSLPSGSYTSYYKKEMGGLMAGPKFERAEFFYLYYLSKLLKPKGLLVVLMSSHWMGSEPSMVYSLLSNRLAFAGAYRVPSQFSGLDLQSEIMVFQGKENKYQY